MSKKKDQQKKQLNRRKAGSDRWRRISADEAKQPSSTAAEFLGRPAAAETPIPTDPLERWWYEYRRADGATKIQMLREKLPLVEQDPEQRELFLPEAFDDLADSLSLDDHARLLEEIRLDYPQVFESQLEWNLFFLSFRYVDEARWDAMEELTGRLAERMTKIGTTYFPLVSLLRLAGRDAAAQQLVDAGLRCLDPFDLMPWAMAELFEWATFPLYERCLQEGLSEEIFQEIDRRAIRMTATPSETTREAQREIARRKRGEGEPWTRERLSQDDDDLAQHVYFMYFDYARWLGERHGVPPVAADELRMLLPNAFDGRSWQLNGFLHGIDRQGFGRNLRPYLGYPSLNRARGPALVLAVHWLFDFLDESKLIDPPVRTVSQRICKDVWTDLQRIMGDNWRKYRFLERYWSG
ncbi:MAG: hypothetical protein JJ992_19335 [Planctomycetes bacterium]|nr:hypothetical protein [Planctomycetota bacterium]